MSSLLEKLLSNPVYIALGVIIVLVLLYSVAKRIIKLIIFIILLLAFPVYVYFTGGDVKGTIEKAKVKERSWFGKDYLKSWIAA